MISSNMESTKLCFATISSPITIRLPILGLLLQSLASAMTFATISFYFVSQINKKWLKILKQHACRLLNRRVTC